MFMIIIYVILTLLLLSFIQKNKKFSSKDPNGPWELPIFGSLTRLDPLGPHRSIQQLATKYGTVFKLWLGDNYTIIVGDNDVYRDILVDQFLSFSDRPDMPNLRLMVPKHNYDNDLTVSKHEIWKPLRDYLNVNFTKTKLKSLGTSIDTCCEELINQLKEKQKTGEPIDPTLNYKMFTISIISRLAFSKPYDQELLDKIIDPMDKVFAKLSAAQIFDTIKVLGTLYFAVKSRTGTEMDYIMREIELIYEDHIKTIDREHPRDLMDLLIVGGYHRELIIGTSVDLFAAGIETSATAMEWFTLLMVNNQSIQETAYQELIGLVGKGGVVNASHRLKAPYMVALLKELLRYKTIGPLGPLPRMAVEDCVVGNGKYFIPKGAMILINLWGLHNDERYFKEPRVFNPKRFLEVDSNNHDPSSLQHQSNLSYHPFHMGPRNCLGSNLALDEMFVCASNILLNFKLKSQDGSILDEKENYLNVVKPNKYKYIFESR